MGSKKGDKRIIIFRTAIMLAIIFVVGSFAAVRMADTDTAEGGNDSRVALAECLTEKGAKLYASYWCPHCVQQKKAFGAGADKLDYVECAIPGNPREQTQECKDAGITDYPTWVFADGSRVTSEQTLEFLAEQTECEWDSSED